MKHGEIEVTKEILVNEAFIRRAALVDMPFMLKGSYITRQYFPDNVERVPADLDWVYLEHIDSEASAKKIFNEWATKVTETALDDGVSFDSFRINAFWRMVDYAMSEDFPTVNTDLVAWVNGEEVGMYGVDISFNLELLQPPVPLLYRPAKGEPFLMKKTVPLSLQVAWKIHQTLLRPRFKDLFDLMYLVQHKDFNRQTLDMALQALVNECATDHVDLNRLATFLKYDYTALFPDELIDENWELWRNNINIPHYKQISYWGGIVQHLTAESNVPTTMNDFFQEVGSRFASAGINIDLFEHFLHLFHTKRKHFMTILIHY